MRILIVTPAVTTTVGNNITAQRWAGVLRALGHQVTITTEWTGEDCDVLIALHARRSLASVEQFRAAQPDRPLIVALTGTDLYRDLHSEPSTHRSLQLATRIVGLQTCAGDEVNKADRSKLRVIYQSAVPPTRLQPRAEDSFEVCVLSHLREVKDPLRAAWAARQLPAESRVRILHAGRALEPRWEALALEEERINPRYRWLRELPHVAARQLLARSRLLVLSSEVEGGANVIAEAVVCGVPVLCSEIGGNIGMLGPDYAGYFPLNDTGRLRALLDRAEIDSEFMQSLRRSIDRLREVFSPDQEKQAWARLLEEIIGSRVL
ncbi:MAG: TIGR04348 family glycosyltransferase [Acidobacteria bacterium]|nr:TIGR04348 family glycosyltransferase [Acidobacteriota bacterium]